VNWLKSRAVLAIAAVVGLGLMAYALFSGDTDEERIVRTLTRLGQVIRFESPPNPLIRGAALNGDLSELVAPDVVLEVPERNFVPRGRDELVRLAVAATGQMQRFEVSFSVQELEVHGDSADVALDVITVTDASEPKASSRRANLRFVKRDDEWLLASARVQGNDDP